MNYEFPHNITLDEVMRIIKGRKEFIVAVRDHFTVVNYIMMGNDTFPTVTSREEAILRELRGLIFSSETGEVLSRRYHKFFNVGEREETLPLNVDVLRPHVLLDKLDGSMISPVSINGAIRLMTKMGMTNVAFEAEVFLAKNPLYEKFCRAAIETNRTPIFEFLSSKREFQIVVPHEKDRLVLTAVRCNETGKYVNQEALVSLGEKWGVEVVRSFAGNVGGLVEYVAELRSACGSEGVVIRFDDGHMLKVKTDWYVQIHRAKDMLNNERHLIGLILNDKVDDFLPLLSNEDQKRVNNFMNSIIGDILLFQTNINLLLAKTSNISRKDFALASADISPIVRSTIFSCWESRLCSLDQVKDIILSRLSNVSRFESLKPILQNSSWKESTSGE